MNWRKDDEIRDDTISFDDLRMLHPTMQEAPILNPYRRKNLT
jgi:hypothetical protein